MSLQLGAPQNAMDYTETQNSGKALSSPVPAYLDFIACPNCSFHVPLRVEGLTWTVTSPTSIAERLLARIGHLEREELWVLTMNTKNQVMDATPLYRGNVTSVQVRVGELFSEAIRRHAAAIAICHTHPSGDPTPSADDLHLTAEAIAAGRILDIRVLDHLILGNGAWTSLRDRGIDFP
jgi:DNA repair protein RadC